MSRLVLLAAMVATVGFAEGAQDKPALDRDFLLQAAPHCHALIQYAALADKRAGNADVKEFAKKLAKDHTQLKEELARAAENQKLAVVSGTEKVTRDEVERLSKLEGLAFDRAFLERVITEHEKGIRLCEAQAEQGKDAKLSGFARTAQLTMKDHLKQARMLLAKAK